MKKFPYAGRLRGLPDRQSRAATHANIEKVRSGKAQQVKLHDGLHDHGPSVAAWLSPAIYSI